MLRVRATVIYAICYIYALLCRVERRTDTTISCYLLLRPARSISANKVDVSDLIKKTYAATAL